MKTGRRHTGKGGIMRGVSFNRTEKRSTSSILAQAYTVFSLLSITYFLFVTLVERWKSREWAGKEWGWQNPQPTETATCTGRYDGGRY
jgi:hypothetical protein